MRTADTLNDNGTPMSTEEQLLQATAVGLDAALGEHEWEPLYGCDCCDRRVPADDLRTGFVYGIETTACGWCRGERKEEQ